MQDEPESKQIDLKGKPKEKPPRKVRRRPHSLETAPSILNPKAAMMGVTYAINPRKINPEQCRYLLSSDPSMYEPTYSLGQMPDGLYVFIKTTPDRDIKTAKGHYFPAGTIICRAKAYISELSAHRLLTMGVSLKDEDIAAAGLILKKTVIVEWNLRTGTYRKLCNLMEEGAHKRIGLPKNKYEPEGQFEPNSPTAAREMKGRHYKEDEELPPSLREQPSKELTPSPRQRSASTGMVIEILKSSSESSIASTSTPTATALTPKTSQMSINPSFSSPSFGSHLHSSKSAESFSSTEEDIRHQKIINSPTETTPPAPAITPKTPKLSMSYSFLLSASFRTSALPSSKSAESFSSKEDLKNKQINSPTPTTPPARTTQKNSAEPNSHVQRSRILS